MVPCPTCCQKSSASMSQHRGDARGYGGIYQHPCLNTKGMLGAMEEYNGISVTSMDEATMFPSLKHWEVARICREEFLKADLKGEVDVDVIGFQ